MSWQPVPVSDPLPPLNRFSKLPLHQQLYEILRGNIVRGLWQAGTMIPTEPELIGHYKISRTTVRQVMDRLVGEGLIIRKQGRGSFVAEPRLEQGLVRIISFTEDMRQRGFTPGTFVRAAEMVAAPADVAQKLGCDEGDTLVRLERLRLANGEPMSLEESFFLSQRVPGLLKYDFATQPLRLVLESTYGLVMDHARQVIRALQAGSVLAKLLNVDARDPILQLERVSYLQDETPVEFLRVHYRADRYSLFNELHE